MIKLEKQFSPFDTIFMKAKNLSVQKDDLVSFEFNGVTFIINTYSNLPKPFEIQDFIQNMQGKEIRL